MQRGFCEGACRAAATRTSSASLSFAIFATLRDELDRLNSFRKRHAWLTRVRCENTFFGLWTMGTGDVDERDGLAEQPSQRKTAAPLEID